MNWPEAVVWSVLIVSIASVLISFVDAASRASKKED